MGVGATKALLLLDKGMMLLKMRQRDQLGEFSP